MAIQLTKTMNAEDVVSKFRRKPHGNSTEQDNEAMRRAGREPGSPDYKNCLNPHNNNRFAQENYRLFEASGNIGRLTRERIKTV